MVFGKKSESQTSGGMQSNAPPMYAAASASQQAQPPQPPQPPPPPDYTQLRLSPGTGFPDSNTCLAHLRFLAALHALKEEVGYTDGVFGMYDSMALGHFPLSLPEGKSKPPQSAQEEQQIRLSRVREKRWAIYVARAVDRYTAWWRTFPQRMLRSSDMDGAGDLKDKNYHHFPDNSVAQWWNKDQLLPLDVLMVMHAHMLNPRDFLEDTMRVGYGWLYASGMPWYLVNTAISSGDYSYNVPESTKNAWVARTGRNWENTDDPMTKTIYCPACSKQMTVPWTTAGISDRDKAESCKPPSEYNLDGTGYCDNNFIVACPYCRTVIDAKLLALGKFVIDVKGLVRDQEPLPGTILKPSTGRPEGVTGTPDHFARTFPNRLVRRNIATTAIERMKPGKLRAADKNEKTMEWVRTEIATVMDNLQDLQIINSDTKLRRGRFPRESRIAVRKMMAHYWDNPGPFALDLAGAVMRQGIFVDKMQKLDWLHSPAAKETMQRLVTKYGRFIDIMAENPGKTCVPTLDIDLAWHTHQLSPKEYYVYTVTVTKVKQPHPSDPARFIDHDDKIDEDRLHLGFEFTSKIYQEKYGEVYSACTCWYCEAVRASHVSSTGRLFGLSNNDQIVEDFYKSGRAQFCPPNNSAHVSAHNAVTFKLTSEVENRRRRRELQKLEQNYNKAVKRAAKKNRQLPPRDEYYDHWGYAYFMYSPYMYTSYYTPGVYPGPDPGAVPSGSSEWATCAAGSCANGVGAGACGAPGGCGNCGGGSNGNCAGGNCGGGGCSGGGDGGDGGGCGGCGG